MISVVIKILCVLIVLIDCSANENFFIEKDSGQLIQVKANKSFTLPCRPTSPDYHVTLTKDGQQINVGGNIEFDKKIGFTIKQAKSMDHYGHFTCTITANNCTQVVTYNVMVLRSFTLNKPVINKKTLRHVVEGQTLRVNCSIDVEKDSNIFYNFGWIKSSNNNTRILSKSYRLNDTKFSNNMIDICELIINNVTYNDEGEYKCKITTPLSIEMTTMNLIVNDPNDFFINLTTKSNEYKINRGNDVQWVVKINAYPQPNISWFYHKPKKQILLNNSDKYLIQNDQYTSLLKINNLTMSDNGIYIIKVEIPDRKIEKSLNFSLKVPEIF